MRIVVEGWRFLPHSYAMIDQFLLLELLDRPTLEVFHKDMPYLSSDWQPTVGLFDRSAEIKLRFVPTLSPDEQADATLRVYCPFNLAPSSAKRTAVFGCTEWGIVTKTVLRGMGVSSFRDAHANSDVTIVTPSQWSREGFIRSGADPDRVVVVPLGVDPNLYRPLSNADRNALRQQFGLDENFVFLNVGLMYNERQGIDRLLKAFAAIADKYPHAKLILKGRDSIFSSRDAIAEAIRKVLTDAEAEKVRSRLIYIGRNLSCADMVHLYQVADAYVSPYLAEGFNLPVLEAIACGLPVICTQGGSTDDFTHPDFAWSIESQKIAHTIEGETGCLLVPNVNHLIDLMQTIIEESTFRDRARQTGPQFVGDRFTWKHSVDGLLQVLSDKQTLSNPVERSLQIPEVSRPRIIVEGWRFFPHSYAIVNQFQLLEMLERPEIEVFHRDAPYGSRNSQPVKGLLDEKAEAALRAIQPPPPNIFADATLRMYSPFNFRPAVNSKRTYIFGTTEWGIVHSELLCLTNRSSLQEIHRHSDTIIVTPSQWSKQGFIRSGADPDRVEIVPLGVDINLYKPLPEEERTALRKQLGWEGKFVFLNVGGMTPEKGIGHLLFAFSPVVDRYPHAKLILKGTDSIYPSKDSIARAFQTILNEQEASKIQERLTYIGETLSTPEMLRLYQAADAYVSPYLAEGFNLPVLEACACGLPVICTKGGPTDDFTHPDFALYIDSEFKSIQQEKENRFILNPNAEHLTELMLKAIAEPELRFRARETAPRFVAERFTWKHVVDQLLQVILPSNKPENISPESLTNRAEQLSFQPPTFNPQSSEKLQKRVAAFPFWYHKIQLPGGVVTPGDNPLDAASYGIPEDLSGKRVLDVGAWDGYWTFEALKRGAREVVAIDDFSDYLGTLDTRDRHGWETFDLCREAFGYSDRICKRLEMSIYDVTPERLGRFDVVFFFGTLYHLRYPLLALDRLSAVCDGEIYIESAILDDYSPYRGGIRQGYPGKQMVMEFYPNDEYAGNSTNYWAPTLYCLAQMVKSAGFSTVKAWKLVNNPINWGLCRGFTMGSKIP